MQTKYKILISSTVAILLGLTCFLIWWFGSHRRDSNNYQPPIFEVPTQEHIHQMITDQHLDEGITVSIKIPKVVYLTYHDIDSIPSSVLDNFEKFCKGYRIEIHGDQSCEDFLYNYYGANAMQLFRQIKPGPHKADFWRYCILYAKGGYYFDIKTNLKDHIDSIFKPTDAKEWFSVTCDSNYPGCIYNGIIVTPPRNPVLWDALINFYKNTNVSYLTHVHYLFRLIKNECAHLPRNGKNPLQNGWQCTLLKEVCTDCQPGVKCSAHKGQDCAIFSDNRQIANVEPDFPWPKKYVSSPNSLLIIDGGKRQYTKMKSSIAIAGSLSYHYECTGFLLDILCEDYRVHVYHSDVEGFIDLFSRTYEFKSIKLPTGRIDGASYDRVIILSSNDPIGVENGKLTTRLVHHKNELVNSPNSEMIKLSPLVSGNARYILPIYRSSLKPVDKRLHRIVVVGTLPNNTRKLLRYVAKHTTIDIIHFSRRVVFLNNRIQNIVGAQAIELEKVMIESRFALVNNHSDRFSGIMALALSCKTPMLMDSYLHDRYKIPALVYSYKKPRELISKLKDMDDNEFENLHEKVINFSEQLLKKNRTICSPFVKGSFTFTEIKNRIGQVKWKGNIPRSLFQVHERRTVPENMAKGMESVMESAPGASYTFYDAEERRKYIKTHYPSALKPYDSLLPGAYRCDIFRYIRLYVEGGVYLDSPYSVSPKRTMFGDVINKNDEFVAAWDIPIVRERKYKAVFNGFIASVPKHPILHELIETALRHVRKQDYLDTALSITGPVMMGRVMERIEASTMKGVRLLDHENSAISDEKGLILFTRYPEYDTDRMVLENGVPRYGDLWDSKNVYKKDETNDAPSASQSRKQAQD